MGEIPVNLKTRIVSEIDLTLERETGIEPARISLGS